MCKQCKGRSDQWHNGFLSGYVESNLDVSTSVRDTSLYYTSERA